MPKAAWMLMVIFALALAGCGGGPTHTAPRTSSTTDATPDTDDLSASPSAARQGTLFIAGGGADADGQLASAFLGYVQAQGQGPAQLLIFPTASSVPVESGQRAAADFRAVATRHDIGVVPLDATDPGRANDPLIAQLIRSADGLWFTGGDPARVTQVFKPTPEQGPATSLADAAVHHMLGRGGSVGATSAGAAALSRHMITGGRSEQALLVGILGGGVEVAPGLALFTPAILDQQFFQRGRLGRLIVALEHTGGRWGLGIDEGKAAVATLGEHTRVTTLGTDSALLIDMAQATRDLRGNRDGIRLSLMGTGDRWAGRDQPPTPAETKNNWNPLQSGVTPTPWDPQTDPWAPGTISAAIHALANNPATPVVMHSRAFRLTLTADARTRFYVQPNDRRDLCAIDIHLKITRR